MQTFCISLNAGLLSRVHPTVSSLEAFSDFIVKMNFSLCVLRAMAPLLQLLSQHSLHQTSKLQYFTDSSINSCSHLHISEIGMRLTVSAMIQLLGRVLFFYVFVLYEMMVHLTTESILAVCEPPELREFAAFLPLYNLQRSSQCLAETRCSKCVCSLQCCDAFLQCPKHPQLQFHSKEI